MVIITSFNKYCRTSHNYCLAIGVQSFTFFLHVFNFTVFDELKSAFDCHYFRLEFFNYHLLSICLLTSLCQVKLLADNVLLFARCQRHDFELHVFDLSIFVLNLNVKKLPRGTPVLVEV